VTGSPEAADADAGASDAVLWVAGACEAGGSVAPLNPPLHAPTANAASAMRTPNRVHAEWRIVAPPQIRASATRRMLLGLRVAAVHSGHRETRSGASESPAWDWCERGT